MTQKKSSLEKASERLKEIDRDIFLFESITALLDWDHQTALPKQGVNARADQISQLSALVHQKVTEPEVGRLLEDLGASEELPGGSEELSSRERGLVRLYFREYTKQKKLPERWVREFSNSSAKGHAVWAEARQKDDFSLFAPSLKRIIALNCEKSTILGFEKHPYDPLLDEYEPGMTVQTVDRVFSRMKGDILRLLDRLKGPDGSYTGTSKLDDSFLYLKYPKGKQKQFGDLILRDMGFDFERGLAAESAHPFATKLGPNDVRIANRYGEVSAASSIFSTIHEGGHALYEMGSSQEDLGGSSLGTGTSLAMHESQSRMWENMIGRSRSFWEYYYPKFQEFFPDQTRDVSLDDMVLAVNKVQPSLIRVNADEVSYGLHIILRYELEKALIQGDLKTDDLPAVWNEKMKALLGIVPPSDADGVLQDVHWSEGMIGYFPTYALGNLMAAQLYAAMERDLGSVDAYALRGDLESIRSWLYAGIHKYGAVYTSSELLKRVTGEELNPSYFTDYLNTKYSTLF